MANQPIDLPLCISQKLSLNNNEKDNSHKDFNDYYSWKELQSDDKAFYNESIIVLKENTTLPALTVSENMSFSTTPMPTNLHSIDSLITHPGYQTLTGFSLLGNLIMISVILFLPQFRKPVNYLIVNLSLSSIFFIVSANLRLAENVYELWDYSTFRCRFLAVIHRIPIPCVALTTMVISLDRGRIARNPMNCSSITPAWKIFFIWSFSVLIVLPLAFTRVHDECIPSAYKCAKVLLFDRADLSMFYGFVYLMSIHLIPAVILINESMKTKKIIKFLRLSISHPSDCDTLPYYSNTLTDNRLRLLRNSCLFTTIFLVFWLPYGIFQFPLDLPKEILPEVLEIYVRFYFRFVRNFSYVQIALNPVILFALSFDLRMYLKRIQLDWRIRMHIYNSDARHNIQRRNISILRMRQQRP